MKKFRDFSTQELQAEISRRLLNPTPSEREKQEKEEREQKKRSVLERLYKEEPTESHKLWEIKAEDENPDLGGPHYQNRLAVVKGSYRKACNYAVTLSGFIGWGYGGNVVPIKQEDFIDLGD